MDSKANELSISMVQWVMACVTFTSASILINGSPSTLFKLQRGLRQGDPLSPFLFVLIAEALNQIILKATSMRLWSGIEICKDGPQDLTPTIC